LALHQKKSTTADIREAAQFYHELLPLCLDGTYLRGIGVNYVIDECNDLPTDASDGICLQQVGKPKLVEAQVMMIACFRFAQSFPSVLNMLTKRLHHRTDCVVPRSEDVRSLWLLHLQPAELTSTKWS
jgi:hypothetical protein